MNIAMNHILMMQRNCFKIHFESILGKRLVINRNKFDWETFNTPKIKTIFYSDGDAENDYGTRDERTRTRIERTLVFVRVRPNMNEREHGFFKKY